MFNPKDDGVKFINVYSKGLTPLGRMLSNFYKSPFTCEDGKFVSIEGYWYWLGLSPDNPNRDKLRLVSGFYAKKLGRELRGNSKYCDPNFKDKILKAISCKLDQHPEIMSLLKSSALPFVHFYCFSDRVIDESISAKFMLDHLSSIRKGVQNG
jgi:hypothetical protein